MAHFDILDTHTQAERLPADPLSYAPGRFAVVAVHPHDRRRKPVNPFAHIVLPDDGERPGAGDS